MFCCSLSYTNSEESFLIEEASVVGLCRGSIQSGVILVQYGYEYTSELTMNCLCQWIQKHSLDFG